MSLAGIQTSHVQDPILARVGEVPVYQIPTGAQQKNFLQTVSNQFSTSVINYTVTPPKGMAVGRVFMQNWQVTFTIQGTSASGPLLSVGTGFGPRAFPIASATTNVQAQLNSGGLNLQYDVLTALFRLSAFWDQDYTELGTFPNELDQVLILALALSHGFYSFKATEIGSDSVLRGTLWPSMVKAVSEEATQEEGILGSLLFPIRVAVEP